MGKKNTSIDRVVSQFKDVDIRTVSLVQALSVKKDANGIKEALGKPNIANSTALGYGRLASQYINMLNKPTNKEIVRIRTKYKVDVEPNGYMHNIVRMGNFKKEKFIEDRGGGVRKGGIEGIMSMQGLGVVGIKNGQYYTSIKATKENKMDFLNRVGLSNKEIQILQENGIYTRQVLLKVEFEDGSEGWVSTHNNDLEDLDEIERLLDETTTYIDEEDPYEVVDVIHTMKGMVEIRINWKN